ncbi:hypothetical protein F511_13859 [Dorcoceras hygrometricum]|uniref:Uncharacterized protein n=1 Tax=Dorcoceras hygrometricum TaxID=472368 RepID=A0A2Z7BVB9_9LAMI|nr:hypothetical protein F511_13859 [Dorcoceras hygrometricum]
MGQNAVSLKFGLVCLSLKLGGPNCNFGLGGLKNCFHIIILIFGNCVDRSDLIVDRGYDEATVIRLNRMFIWTWARPRPIGLVQAHASPLCIRLVLGLYNTTHNSHTLDLAAAAPSPLHSPSTTVATTRAAAVCRRRCFFRGWTCSDQADEEIPFVTNSSGLLVQTDEGGVIPIVDRIRRSTAAYR